MLLAPHCLLSLLSYTPQDPLLRGGTACRGVDPHTSIINHQENGPGLTKGSLDLYLAPPDPIYLLCLRGLK